MGMSKNIHYKKIPLSQNYEAIVDDDIYDIVEKFKWHSRITHGSVYAGRNIYDFTGKRKILHLHHIVIGCPLFGLMVDHINGNSLDNRRENLRIVTNRQNSFNRKDFRSGSKYSKYIGVTWDKQNKKWVAQIMVKNKRKFLGRFANEIDAAKAYQEALQPYDRRFR